MTLTKRIGIIVSLLFGIQSYSQQIITDRPDQTESSSTIGLNDLQIESGMLFMNSNEHAIKSFAGPSTLVRVGLMKGFELRLVNQYEELKIKGQSQSKYTGWSDLQIGAKVQLLKNTGKTEIAFLTHFVIPTAKSELTNDELGLINKLSISHNIGDRFGLGYNVGYDFMGSEHQFTYSLAFGISLANNLSMFIEPFGSFVEGGYFESNFDTGITFLLSDNFQLDASYGFGLNHEMDFFTVGFSWRLQELFKSSQ